MSRFWRNSNCSHIRRERGDEFFRETFQFFLKARADMKRLAFEDQCVALVRDAVGKIQPHTLGGGEPDFDVQRVVVTRGSFVAEMRFNHWKNVPRLLQLKKSRTGSAEQFSARGLDDFQITPVIDVVADSAVGVGDATLMNERFLAHAQASLRFFNTCTVEAALLRV